MTDYQLAVGSRAQVFHGTARRTSGGLTKSDLKKNRHGEIVSKKASAAAAKSKGFKLLKSGGYVVKRGQKPLLGKPKRK